MKRRILYILAVLLLLFGCSAKDQKPQKIDVDPKSDFQIGIQSPEKNDDTIPDRPDEPTEQEQVLLDSELAEFDPGMVWRYVGEDLVFQPKGWNVAFEIPEAWEEKVTVLCSHPNGEELAISVIPNVLIEAYMTDLKRPVTSSYYDYCLRLICQPKENGPETYPDACVKIFEDEENAYYLETMLERSPNSQESQLQQLLIEKIGQAQYDAITKDFLLTIESAKDLFVFNCIPKD